MAMVFCDGVRRVTATGVFSAGRQQRARRWHWRWSSGGDLGQVPAQIQRLLDDDGLQERQPQAQTRNVSRCTHRSRHPKRHRRQTGAALQLACALGGASLAARVAFIAEGLVGRPEMQAGFRATWLA